MTELILASASPRRLDLLAQIGFQAKTFPVDIDETPRDNESPISYVERMATEKLEEALRRLNESPSSSELVVVAGDTVCIQNGRILVKPRDYQDFNDMLSAMSDSEHTVATSFAIGQIASGQIKISHLETVRTRVIFRSISSEEMQAYWASGEPKDKAGGYGIQGRGAIFVKEVHGSYSNVVGLPLLEVDQVLQRLGVLRVGS